MTADEKPAATGGLMLTPDAKERVLIRKPLADILDETDKGQHLKRELGPFQLTALGVGAIVGTGIFVLIGPAIGEHAGPSIVVSMLIAGLTCALIALCYAELASMIPVAGSAYTYSYATLGEFVAWIIGWDLILEYAVGAVAVAIGWSGYFYNLTASSGMPYGFTHPPSVCDPELGCGIINLPAIGIVLALTFLLGRGVKEAVNLNTLIVLIKLIALAIFVGVGIFAMSGAAFSPFQPMGWGGTLTGAAVIFFAFIGFDAVSTAAEEAKNPGRDMKIAILGSLGIASLVYITVAFVLVGMLTPQFDLAALGRSSSALADALGVHGQGMAAGLVAGGALFAITSVLLVSLYAQPRLFFALARDGLLPPRFAELDPKSHVPKKTIYLTGFIVAFFAGFVGIGDAAHLTSIGTLFAFILVGIGVLWLRKHEPNAKRPFKAPFFPVVPIVAIAMSIALMLSLPFVTWMRFGLWLMIGFLIYAHFGIFNSKIARRKYGLPPAAPPAPPKP